MQSTMMRIKKDVLDKLRKLKVHPNVSDSEQIELLLDINQARFLRKKRIEN